MESRAFREAAKLVFCDHGYLDNLSLLSLDWFCGGALRPRWQSWAARSVARQHAVASREQIKELVKLGETPTALRCPKART